MNLQNWRAAHVYYRFAHILSQHVIVILQYNYLNLQHFLDKNFQHIWNLQQKFLTVYVPKYVSYIAIKNRIIAIVTLISSLYTQTYKC